MLHVKKPPHPLLQSYIKSYWYLDAPFSNPGLQTTVMPEHALYFYPKAKVRADYTDKTSTLHTTIICIPNQDLPIMSWNGHYVMLKVLFHPTGFFRLFGIPMSSFGSRAIDPIDVFGSEFKELYERIEESGGFEQMMSMLDAFFLKKAQTPLKDTLAIDAAINSMLEATVFSSVDEAAKNAYLSTRQFERNFIERVGILPKRFSRIVRFSQAMKLKQEHPQYSWMTIAYECGYHDHMHLLRDFRHFTSKVPSNFDFEQALIY
jgi:AraC-like DNA-binding protein